MGDNIHNSGGQNIIIVVISALALISGYILSQMWLHDKAHQRSVASVLTDINKSVCGKGIKLPGLQCKPAKIGHRYDHLTEAVSGFPNLAVALEHTSWKPESEADTAKFLAILQSQVSGRHYQSQGNYQAVDYITTTLQPIWQQYPYLVAGSSCTYCGIQINVMSKLLYSARPLAIEKASHFVMNPVIFAALLDRNLLPEKLVQSVLPAHAILSPAGDSRTASAIGRVLINEKRWNELKIWVDNGLNGGWSIRNYDYSLLPRDVVTTAWEHGIAIGNADSKLTAYLISTGYRPALRWVLWLQSTNYGYLNRNGYSMGQVNNGQLVGQYTDFPVDSGKELGVFYNNNWRSIHWSDTKKKWLSKRG